MTKAEAEHVRDLRNTEYGAGTHYIELREHTWIVRKTPWFSEARYIKTLQETPCATPQQFGAFGGHRRITNG